MYDIYLAGPFFDKDEAQLVEQAKEILDGRGFYVFSPKEHFIPNAWDLTNAEWGEAVFEMDKQAIHDCKYVVAVYHGMYSDTGTAWEVGYAHALEKKILIVCVNDDKSSLMISNGCTAVIDSVEELNNFDFDNFPTLQSEREQK